ncbi:MAG: hypothetical protein WAR79_05775 [Melioribacteraceae bacterium]
MFNTREEFIKVIVEKVLSKLIESGKIPEILINIEICDFNKKLVTISDAEFAKSKGYKKINILPNTIITPLAYDLLKESGIKIVYSKLENNCCTGETKSVELSNKIAVLSNLYDESYKNKTKEILLKLGIESEFITPENLNYYEFQNSLDDLIEKVNKGLYKSSIIISNDAFKLKKRLQNLGNFNSQICWEIDNAKVCSVKSKFLFVNSSLIGFKMLEQKINSWINFNKN